MSTILSCFLTIFITECTFSTVCLHYYLFNFLAIWPLSPSQSAEGVQWSVITALPNQRIPSLASLSLNSTGLCQPPSSFLKLPQFSRAIVFWVFLFQMSDFSHGSNPQNINLSPFCPRLNSSILFLPLQLLNLYPERQDPYKLHLSHFLILTT